MGECSCGWKSSPAPSCRSIEEDFVEHNEPPHPPHQAKRLHELKILAKASPAQRSRESNEQSKDLEKDEREWKLEGLDGLGERGPRIEANEDVVVVPKARLQRVEAELNSAKVAIDTIFEERDSLREIIAEKDLIIKASEQHTQYWEDKCAE